MIISREKTTTTQQQSWENATGFKKDDFTGVLLLMGSDHSMSGNWIQRLDKSIALHVSVFQMP